MKTMCPPGYHHNSFVVAHALGHMMDQLYISIYIYVCVSVCVFLHLLFNFPKSPSS